MGKHAQIVMGPAGSGKSTYCNAISKHCEVIGRPVHVVNLDPAAEHFEYPVAIDIRDLISLTDVIEELNYGPNGGLIYCMEYLLDNLNWLSEAIADYGDDYLIFDCPGQIELYTHLPVMQRLTRFLTNQCGYSLCGLYLLDSLFVSDSSRFMSGTLMCLSAMVQLELPHINILTKCDLIENKKTLRKFLDPDMETVMAEMENRRMRRGKTKGNGNEKDTTVTSSASSSSSTSVSPSSSIGVRDPYAHLTRALSSLVEQYSLVNFFPLDLTSEDSIGLLLQHIDRANAYGEDLEPKEPKDKEHEIGLDAIQE